MTMLALLSLIGWLYVTAARRLWRGAPFLDETEIEGPLAWPQIVAVVPARNEAEVIARAVRSLIGQNYQGRLSIVVVDDESTDGTADAARHAGAVDVIRGTAPPDGWTGKLWALDTGVRHALQAYPDASFFWFTDADIEHSSDELRNLAALSEARRLDLASVMVKLSCETFWDRLLIPAFVFFFQKLYPFHQVNNPKAHTAGAAGGSMLVRRMALDRIGGFATIKGELIDDCALAREIKRGGPIWLGFTESTHSLRRYRSLRMIRDLVARTAYHHLRYSPLALTGTVISLILLYAVPPVAIVLGGTGGFFFGAIAWVLMAWNYRPTLRLYGLSAWHTLLLPITGVLYALFTLDSALRHWQGRGGAWKARYYPPRPQA
jgi:hopene-associated glycosyltransferase HpnB